MCKWFVPLDLGVLDIDIVSSGGFGSGATPPQGGLATLHLIPHSFFPK